MDSWEVPGERPEAVWRRFGSSLGAFEALSENGFQFKKIIISNFQSKRGREVFFNSSKRMKRFASDQI